MRSDARRAFLMGRRPASSPWEQFCSRLRRAAQGPLTVLDTDADTQAARLLVQQAADVHHARALCAEYGVCMALEGVPAAAPVQGPVLWLRLGNELSACRRLELGGSRWFIQPGCMLGELEAQGLECFADLPGYLTVAAWLADRRLCNWSTGGTAASGLVHASALLADGVTVSLGAFGPENRKALDNLRLQRLIPALFSLVSSADGRICSEYAAWPGRYRLDALQPARDDTLNLSHLLLGHGGDLAWVEWIVLDEALVDTAAANAVPLELPWAEGAGSAGNQDAAGSFGYEGGSGPCDHVNLARAAQDLDAAVKELFDPTGVFPHPGQAL